MIYSPGLTRIPATVGGKQRYYSRDVQQGLNNPSLFIFFAGGGDSSTKLNKLFGVFLKKYNMVGIYMEAQVPVSGKANFNILAEPSQNNDVAFYNYVLQQFPDMNIFVAGTSTGACMALYLACHGYCDSICTFAGSVWQGLTISYKPNIFAAHGQLDLSCPFNGSAPGRLNHGVSFLSAYSSIEKFSAAPIKRTVTAYPLTGQMNLYTSPNQSNSVKLLTVGDLGHNIIGYKGVVNNMGLIESMFYWLSNLPVVK